MLGNLFKQHNVPLWGFVSLGEAIGDANGYGCIAFCFPYDRVAVDALPDDNLMNRCKKDLAQRTSTVYKAIGKAFSECRFVFYDDVDREIGLRERGISQKVLGYLVGLGWIGRSSLLVTPEFGPRVRLGTIFTKDYICLTGHPYLGNCGECMACSEACPVSAITKKQYDVNKCRRLSLMLRGNTGLSAVYVCGFVHRDMLTIACSGRGQVVPLMLGVMRH